MRLPGSPFVTVSRGSSSRKTRKKKTTANLSRSTISIRSSVSSLFDDLDPDSSPLMIHLEKKIDAGVELTEEDFEEPYFFKKKMENEFDEIAEKFKCISIDNPEESEIVKNETADEEDVFIFVMPESSDTEQGESVANLGDNFVSDHIPQNDESELMECENKSLLKIINLKNVKHSLICQLIICIANEGLNYII